MVVMMRWPSWPNVSSRKFEVTMIIYRLEGINMDVDWKNRLVVEIKWKGQKIIGFRRSVRRNFTEEGGVGCDNNVEWNEEFRNVCNFSGFKGISLHPWEIAFTVFHGFNHGARNKVSTIATASLNLSEFVTKASEKEITIQVPLTLTGNTSHCSPSICLSLSFLELRPTQETTQAMQASVLQIPQPLPSTEENSSDGRTPQNTLSDEYSPGDESEDDKEDVCLSLSVNNETLAYSQLGGRRSFYSSLSSEDESWVYYSNRELKTWSLHVDEKNEAVSEQSSHRSSKLRILAWNKRKMKLQSSKAKAKGEPLLKKHYGEVGGDDIDFDRRQLSSSDESGFEMSKSEDGSSTSRSSVSEFGDDDSFVVGSWEKNEVISRDGRRKLETQVFFASIDQRSVRAAGESACTALVAVIANWLQCHPDEMPIKSELHSLIREGSSEWRKLCENEDYRERFPDKHFDLETVIEAKIGNLSVVQEKSFIGFFQPEGGEFEFLDGAMSFDSIWEEISRCTSDCIDDNTPTVYIVSWNDHFFVLKVDKDAYYIIDTLGERLFEGCSQAYVLKFDKDTSLRQVPYEKADKNKVEEENEDVETVVTGKESCKEYIKSFLAAIPIRELQVDIKKGLMASTVLHHRLQIEFHYTQLSSPAPEALQLAL